MEYKCKEKCPICGSDVEVFGSECYPVDGITAECTSDSCCYSLDVNCTVRSNGLINITKVAHGLLCAAIREDIP